MMGTNREHAKQHQMRMECPSGCERSSSHTRCKRREEERSHTTRVTASASRDREDEETIVKGSTWKEPAFYSLLWWPSAGGRPTR